jgi:hypothetical protein
VSRWCLRVAGRRAYMTDHAIERYGQRVRPHLQRPDELYADARRLVEVAGVLAEDPPEWVAYEWVGEHMEARGWLVCGDIAMPLAEDRQRPGRLVALTVLTRGSISDEARRNRNRKRSHRTYAKRKRNKMDDRLTRGHRPEIAVEFDG